MIEVMAFFVGGPVGKATRLPQGTNRVTRFLLRERVITDAKVLAAAEFLNKEDESGVVYTTRYEIVNAARNLGWTG